MDNKFYVSYEVARLLKEKGYDTPTNSVYNLNLYGENFIKQLHPENWNKYKEPSIISVPTKAEAIDWLDSKGIIVELNYEVHKHMDNSRWEYFVYTYDKDRWFEAVICSWEESNYFNNRLEAEEAAIIKALELL